MCLSESFHINYAPLLKKIKEELELRNLLPISLLRQINVQLSLGLSSIEKTLESSTSLKRKISLISALLDHHSSFLTPGYQEWYCDFSNDQWDIMCQNVFTSLSCNKIIWQNHTFRHTMCLTPLHLSKMYPNLSSRCHYCKTRSGSFFHKFCECRKWKHFCTAVYNLTFKVLEIFTPIWYLFWYRTGPHICKEDWHLVNWNKQILNETLHWEQHTLKKIIRGISLLCTSGHLPSSEIRFAVTLCWNDHSLFFLLTFFFFNQNSL